MKNRRLWQLIIGAGLYAAGVIVGEANGTARLIILLTAFVVAGGDVAFDALRGIVRGEIFDENFLMTIAAVGAFIIGEQPEGVAVMVFYQVGELFQGMAVDRSRRSISALMDIRPDFANVLRGGEPVRVSPDTVAVGDLIVIKPGERVPLDARVTDGFSALDVSALTGESLPRDVTAGDEILSGCINLSGLLTAEVTREHSESTASKILDLVENAAGKKATTEHFITRFARYYTPTVVALAAIISLVPPLIVPGEVFSDWVYRGLTFLVISCPCALVVSIPLGFFGGIGGASRRGILVKGGNYLEALARTEIVVFDKTGTLTKGKFAVSSIHAQGMTERELLEKAAYVESYSTHPISVSILAAFGEAVDSTRLGDVEEIPGQGVCAVMDGERVIAGNAKLMAAEGVACDETNGGTTVHVAVGGIYAGYICVEDEIRDDSRAAVEALRRAGVKEIVMLTGDSQAAGERVARELGLDAAYTGLLPAGKVERVEELIARKSPKGVLVFAGDGINDAPVLARADVGIAMGGVGSDAAIEAADVVIMTDEPSKIPAAIGVANRTLRIVKQNIVFALGFKGVVLALAAFGFVSMWAGVIADVGVAILAVLNATRGLKAQ